MLMLIDTPDPRYRPGEKRGRSGSWRRNLRVWLPCLAAIACLLVAGWVPPIASYVLTFAGLALALDGASSALPGDGLRDHRQ